MEEKDLVSAVVTLLVPVIGVVGTIIAGVGWLIKNSITKSTDKALKEHQHELEKKITDLKNTHDISKETYSEIFKKRADLYKKIYPLIYEFENSMIAPTQEEYAKDEISDRSTNEWGEKIITFFDKLRSLIFEEQIYVSQDLWELFKKVEDKYRGYLHEIELISYLDDMEYLEQNSSLTTKYYDILSPSLKDLLNVVEIDLSKIRSSVKF